MSDLTPRMVRVRYRNGEVRHYGPMAPANAASKVALLRRLALNPESPFAAACAVRHFGGAHELGHEIHRAAFALYGGGWEHRIPDLPPANTEPRVMAAAS